MPQRKPRVDPKGIWVLSESGGVTRFSIESRCSLGFTAFGTSKHSAGLDDRESLFFVPAPSLDSCGAEFSIPPKIAMFLCFYRFGVVSWGFWRGRWHWRRGNIRHLCWVCNKSVSEGSGDSVGYIRLLRGSRLLRRIGRSGIRRHVYCGDGARSRLNGDQGARAT